MAEDQHYPAEWHMQSLLKSIDMPSTGGTLTLEGDEVPCDSPHRLECAASAALGAQALAAAHLWHMRTGGNQEITIDRTQAINALRSGLFQWIEDHDMNIYTNGAKGAVSNLFETADGRWIYLVGPYPGLRDGLLSLLECPNNEEAIAAAVRRWNSFELEDEVAARNLAGAVVRTREEWDQHPQAKALKQAPLIEIRRIEDSAPRPLGPASRPLEGVRVIDFTHVIAGPSLTRTLAEHGADVLRLMAPRFPDPTEFLLDTGWGKRSAYLDLDVPGNMDKLDALLEDTDIFVQSWSPRSIGRRGLSPEELCKRHPGLIYVQVNAFGFAGPWAERKGFEQIAQSVSGMAAAEGGSGRPRLVPTSLLADYLCAYLGAAGAMAALKRRAEDGGSYEVRVSLTGAIMWVQGLGQNVATGGELPEPVLVERETPFGRLRHMPPVTKFSQTPAEWTLPPSTPGAHKAQW
ncbi:CoA transferase [Pseudarthrobacter sp. YAF2]|uniref:CoA transferase n=1 Tax=Pseudarthrobacter sp. YAF2 TaxID=3233078 RepID=UPI003F99A552